MAKLKIGLIVNPLAGIGGAVGLKGSDGPEIVAEAQRRGAKPQAVDRAARALAALIDQPIELLVFGGAMGATSAELANVQFTQVGSVPNLMTSADDTRQAAKALFEQNIDLLLFAGGDGTARDIASVNAHNCPVLGIPAGCKMHSGVYANNPEDAGQLLAKLAQGGLVDLVEAEVRDIDEEEFRQGRVNARYYATMLVPRSDGLLQQVKSGRSADDDEVTVTDIAAYMAEQMEPDHDYLIGSGTTVAEVMNELGLPNTLLGVDLVRDNELVASDIHAAQILALTGERPLHAVVTIIGGQGHLFGRGNQQLSPDVIRRIDRQHLHVLATRSKLAALDGRPLLLDTGDAALDNSLSGWVSVIVGYDERVLYPLGKQQES